MPRWVWLSITLFTLFTLFAVLFLVPADTFATEATPPLGTTSPGGPGSVGRGDVHAVVVKSWGSGSGALVWDHLHNNWSNYGSIPISIDYTTLHEAASFTLQDLQNSGADVVIVSDPAGGLWQWSPAEIAALQSYAQQGHNLVGTYILFQWDTNDNRGLAPLWGLRSDLVYNSSGEEPASPTTPLLVPVHCLFDGISDPLDTGGFPFVQVPLNDTSWDPNDMNGAQIVARSADGNNVVTSYDGPGYFASYISYMPEYQGGEFFEATKYLYNAIVCTPLSTSVEEMSWGRIKATF